MSDYSLTMLILSCDKYSDLWDAHVHHLEKYWPDRQMPTFIVTDKKRPRYYEHIEILAFESASEWSERLKEAIRLVDTEFVFITMDDYFLVKPVSTDRISVYIDMMKRHNIDYLRLFIEPRKSIREPVEHETGIFWIDTEIVYSLNLYTGIWRKSFLENTFKEPLNAWRYEVKLARRARENNAHCAMTKERVFPFLDVVRKGKLLRKAARYLKRIGIFLGDREVNSFSYEMQIQIRRIIIEYMPQWAVNRVRSIMVKFGQRYFSEDA